MPWCHSLPFAGGARILLSILPSQLVSLWTSLDALRPVQGLVVFTFGFVALHQLLLKVCDLIQRWTFSLEHVGTYVMNCDKI